MKTQDYLAALAALNLKPASKETARVLGLTRRGLYLKLRRLGLETRAEAEVDVS